jgi:hypothetical protein
VSRAAISAAVLQVMQVSSTITTRPVFLHQGAQRGQSGSERLAPVCYLSPSPTRRGLGGVRWRGDARCGKALAAVPREEWFYIPYAQLTPSYIIVGNETMNVLCQTILLHPWARIFT